MSGSSTSATTAGRIRWIVCALLFAATAINYVDRNALSVLKTTLQLPGSEGGLGFSDADYGWITFAFSVSYAAFPSLVGTLIDRFGVKASLAGALLLWSAAAALHGLAASVMGFIIARFLLGLAESANFPASIKAVAIWFPQKERAFATGLFNSGTALGVIASPLTVWIASTFGWRWAFVATGAIGVFWLVFWLRNFHQPAEHPRLTAEELEFIQADQPPPQARAHIPWSALMRCSDIWPFLLGKLLTDPVWWFFLFWLPSYLDRERGQNPLKSAGLVALIYAGSSVGSIAGGWFSSSLIRRGWSVGKSRMTAMAMAAMCMPVSILAYYTDNYIVCVALIALATAGHQAWSANLLTSATDLFPAEASGAVVGLGSTAGGIGGMFIALLAALVVQWTGKQQGVFLYAGMAHMAALILYWFWFKGVFKPAQIKLDAQHLNQAHKPLLLSGAGLIALGLALSGLIAANWAACIAAAGFSGAAQAATAAAGVGLIGVALLFAGWPRRAKA
ncbi:MAG TPA: MFS transporter [Burkholderiaceae bacterium]|jgi:ACS family hexuronate transporter-like MFS transporter